MLEVASTIGRSLVGVRPALRRATTRLGWLLFVQMSFITTNKQLEVKFAQRDQLCLFAINFVCLIVSLVCFCLFVVFCVGFVRVVAILSMSGGGTPKIASPLRRNMSAQIYVNFDRYIPMNAGTLANLSQNRWVCIAFANFVRKSSP